MSLQKRMQVRRADATRLTHEYHQTVLRLTQDFSTTEVAWDVSQHVLGRLWDDDSSANGGSAQVVPPASSASATPAHACQRCGYRLYPGWKGTSLRVKRPKPPSSLSAKRTIRRREQRKRRRTARAEEMKAKDHTTNSRRHASSARPNTTTPDGNSADTDSDATAKQPLVLLRDDPNIGRLDRYRLVLNCGRCRDKTHLKGLRRDPQQKYPGNKSNPAVVTARTTKATIGRVDDLSDNFIRLPKLSKKPPPPRTAAGAVNAAKKSPFPTKMSLLEQKMAGKKKKKKTDKTSGNFLNFLSSLNDN